MTQTGTETLIEALAGEAGPVTPLRPPLVRALTTLGAIALVGAAAVYFLSDVRQLLDRYRGRETMLALEMAAMLATGLIAITGAFFGAVPGRSRLWLVAPLPFFAAWLLLSGAGCYRDFIRGGPAGWGLGESMNCLLFILAASAALAPPIIWRLSRASPVDPLPVALLGGLGIAALSAFFLQFFHPFTVTFLDLGVHLAAILLVVGVAGSLNRHALRPA